MMRKIFMGVLVIALFYFGYVSLRQYGLVNISKKVSPNGTASVPPTAGLRRVEEKKSIFVPDWSLNNQTTIDSQYDRYIYFGSEGKISQFVDSLKGKELWYTEKVNTVNELNQLRPSGLDGQAGFEGIVLDLEISELPTEKLMGEINKGVYEFFKAAKRKNLKVALALYGDLFYRRRPYDLNILKDYCDEIMVMAYDFHKSNGEPGPNFPFNGRDVYGYDFKMMTEDYLKFVPPEKLTVVFGMYGYDWLVDENKKPIRSAKAVTIEEIKKNFIDKCAWKNCVIRRDEMSGEQEIDYIYSIVKGDYGYMDMHIVWNEDEQSVAEKFNYLKEKGVGSIGYWAYGYF